MYLHDSMNPCEKSTDLDELLTAQQKKQRNKKAAVLCEKHLSAVGKQRMDDCGDWLWMLENSSQTKKKLERGFFCGNRFCPACAWRYAAAWGRALCTIDRYLADQSLIPLFVTLTVPNVPADQLRAQLRSMAQAWDKLIRRKRYKAWSTFARKTEVTYNKERNDYHPHYHALIWVDPSYFSSGDYIKHAQLLSDWKAATGDSSIKHVRVQRCTSAKGTGAAVAEVAKYVAKSADYLDNGQEVFDGFYDGLHGTRIITLGGRARRALALYRAGDLLAFQPDKPDELEEYTIRAIYHWQRTGYERITEESVDLREEATQNAEARRILLEDIQAMANQLTDSRDIIKCKQLMQSVQPHEKAGAWMG